MRWFRHLSTASADERLAEMKDAFGLEGMGFWWTLLEIIALQMDGKNQKCEATYSLAQWSRKIGCHHHKTSVFFQRFEGIGLIDLAYDGNKATGRLTVTVSNLVKYRDEYTTRKGGCIQEPEDLP